MVTPPRARRLRRMPWAVRPSTPMLAATYTTLYRSTGPTWLRSGVFWVRCGYSPTSRARKRACGLLGVIAAPLTRQRRSRKSGGACRRLIRHTPQPFVGVTVKRSHGLPLTICGPPRSCRQRCNPHTFEPAPAPRGLHRPKRQSPTPGAKAVRSHPGNRVPQDKSLQLQA